MALKAPKGAPQKDFVPQANIEPGTYPARLVQIIDFGLQPQRAYKGAEKPPAQEIGLTYELVDEFMKDENGEDILDKPRWISETLPFYGLYADKAKSTQRYLVFDPKVDWDGDFSKAIGEAVNVTVINNVSGDKVYDNIATISAMRPRDAANCPGLKNPAKTFDLDAPDITIFNSFPKWIQDKIKSNLNYNGSPLHKILELGVKAVPKKEEKEKNLLPEEDDSRPY